MSLRLLWPGAGDSQAIDNPAASAPAAPALVASPADSQVGLSWDPVDTATAYQPFKNGTMYGSPMAGTAVIVTALTNGTPYTFTVAASNPVGSTVSAPVVSTPVAAGVAPDAPVLSAGPGNAQASLSWAPVSGATSYQPQVNGSNVGSPTAGTTATVTGLTNGTSYALTVVAINTFGSGPASNAITVVPSASVIPTQPAAWSDLAADVAGANLHTPFTNWIYKEQGPYPSPAAAVKATLDYARIRHIRDNLSVNSAAQRSTLHTICADGIDILFSVGSIWSGQTAPNVTTVVSDVTSHYADLEVVVEGLNESNHSGNSNWASITRTFQQNLWNAAHPAGLTVVSPPLADGTAAPGQLGSVDAWSDVAAIHVYPGGQKPPTNIASHVDASATNVSASKPMWLTECGYNTAIHAVDGNSPVTEAVQAVYTPILMLEAYRRGITRAYLYELADDRRNDALDNTEKNFGLFAWDAQVEPSWRAKPAATSLRNMQGLLADPGSAYTPPGLQIAVTGGDSGLRQLLFGKRDGSYLLCLWRDVSVWTPSATVKNGGKPVTVAGQTISVALGSSKTIKRYQPDSSASAQATVTGTSTTVNLAGSLIVLTLS